MATVTTERPSAEIEVEEQMAGLVSLFDGGSIFSK
jgi:hypothetical protein